MLGETISHYKIIEKLGEGGMGVVYRAVDTKLDREVAIKFLPPHLSSDTEATKRFIHEAKAASAIDHSHIGTIHEIDETENGVTFIVMALYDGETLRERMDRGELNVEESLEIASQIASGLSKAHQKDIVHRDIKPSNIIITSDREVKIIDFGLAKLAGRTRLTKEASTLGTAAYMSPEQARGEEVDHRSDIFSLGVILYEMLAGKPPFKGEHEAALLYEIVHEEAATLSTHRSDIPFELQHILDRTLDKRREERYQDIQGLLEDIELIKEGSKTVKTGRVRKAGLAWKYIIPVITVGIIVSVIFIFQQRLRKPAIRKDEMSLAIVDFSNLVDPDDPTISLGLTKLLENGLIESSPIRVVSRSLLLDLRRRLFGAVQGPIEDDQALEIARKSGATLLLSGQIARTGNSKYVLWQLVRTHSGECVSGSKVDGENLLELADRVIDRALPVIDIEAGVDEVSTSPSVNEYATDSPEAYRHYIEGLLAREGYQSKRAIHELEQALAIDSTFALALIELSRVYAHLGDEDIVCKYAESAWNMKEHLSVKDRMRLEGWLLTIKGQLWEAKAIHQEVFERWPDDADAHLDFVRIYWSFSAYHEIAQLSERFLELYPDNIRSIAAFYWSSLAYIGNDKIAINSIREFTERYPEVIIGWEYLGWQYLNLGHPDSAEVAFRRSLEIDPQFYHAFSGIASCAYHSGDLSLSIERFERMVNSGTLMKGQYIRTLIYSVDGPALSMVHAEAGRFNKALETIEAAKKYTTGPDTEMSYKWLISYILLRIGKAEEVLKMARDMERNGTGTTAYRKAMYPLARSLVALDSLDMARGAAQELHRLAESHGKNWHRFQALNIEAEIELKKGNPTGAIALLNEAKSTIGLYPLGLVNIEWRENLAHAYRMAGDLEEAVNTHQELLRVHGGHVLSHYELGILYEEMNRPADARGEYERFLDMWSEADEGLPQLEDARMRLAKLKGV